MYREPENIVRYFTPTKAITVFGAIIEDPIKSEIENNFQAGPGKRRFN